ncbi:hypothetical protein CABS01_07773 [Colletotrichum abscissum]|uniref:Uncharacterized protein n=1 Tax=Colletotrichum abscissum TaxID=1671311 RepID=A0A9Q0B916_9PEZI|nr:uncharacterized protein CABS01_07773 [Colletotrichum abscissum]KAI3557823.1 hypothetical protein CABS02_02005 [Colletotrichum abscissum]KAK1510101.1 hypothetical protein CABS01_07773 [Colletotrichum abscissum]
MASVGPATEDKWAGAKLVTRASNAIGVEMTTAGAAEDQGEGAPSACRTRANHTPVAPAICKELKSDMASANGLGEWRKKEEPDRAGMKAPASMTG